VSGAARAPAAARARDPRLDFFRGLAMFIIVIAHTPGNAWTLWIPARFGFSDATEIFVFCSGMASAVAFGGTFARRGWLMGTARTLHRVWQVYWFHIGAFVATTGLAVALTASGAGGRDFVVGLNLGPFLDDPATALPALLTLRYVPNYFDILPMYLVILAMLPVAMALARVHLGLVALACATLWLVANLGRLDLPAAPWSEARWFFNPFGWQLVFFTGFAFMAGWLPAPPVRPALVLAAAAILAASLPFAWHGAVAAVPAFAAGAEALRPLTDKTAFGLLRYVHFLALAYLAFAAAGRAGARLGRGRAWPRVVAVVQRVGQQSLAVFVVGLALSQLLGAAIGAFGRDPLTTAVVNLAGIGAVVATAYLVGWVKSEPWRRPAAAAAQAPAPEGAREPACRPAPAWPRG
jgi:hypothetical protein